MGTPPESAARGLQEGAGKHAAVDHPAQTAGFALGQERFVQMATRQKSNTIGSPPMTNSQCGNHIRRSLSLDRAAET